MKKIFFILLALLVASNFTNAQSKIFTKTGKISFHSDGNAEKIEALNKKVTCIINTETGQMEFAVLMKAFEFEKALMQEHFNENYVESTKFPKSTFKGNIENISDVNFSKDGTYNAIVKGNLTMHGVTKPVSSNGTITVKGGKVTANSVFNILLSDYKITIPALVKENISNEVKITVNADLAPLTK